MTPEQMRVAVCEVLGWKFPGHPDHTAATEGWVYGHLFVIHPDGQVVSRNAPPALTLDLMFQAEEAMPSEYRAKYMATLYRDVIRDALIEASYDGEHDFEGYFSIVHATAEQRAEALLRLGRWPEPKGAA